MKTTTKKGAKKIAPKNAKKTLMVTGVRATAGRVAITGVKAKKVVPKKIKSASTKKTLVIASNYNSFWMNDGQILNTLTSLASALKTMDTAVYKYHTASGRHDFANWVLDVLHDKDCAGALRKAKTPKSAYAVVVKHLALYQL